MSIRVTCPQCSTSLKTKDEFAGKRAKCPTCKYPMRIPQPPPPESEVFEAEEFSGFVDENMDFPAEVQPLDDRTPCRACGEMIAIGAMKCRFCGEVFDPVLKSVAKRKKPKGSLKSHDTLSAAEWVLAVIGPGIAIILGIVWIVDDKPKGIKMLGATGCGVLFWLFLGFLAMTFGL